MVKTTTAVMNKQNGKTQKSRYTLLNQEGQIVATLIDLSLAEKWVADRKRGAVRFIAGAPSEISQKEKAVK
jgi:hypothetical protein